MIRSLMTGVASLCLIVGAVAQQPPKSDAESAQQRDRATKIGEERDSKQQGASQQAAQNQEPQLPESLKQLDLSDQQQQKILAIYRENDRKAQEVWNRVQELHHTAISMEAAVMAAARLESNNQGAQGNAAARQNTSGAQTTQSRTSQPSSDNPVNRTALKPATDAADQTADRKTPGTQAADRQPGDRQTADVQQNARNKNAADSGLLSQSAADSQGNELNIVAIRVGVAQPDGSVREFFLAQPISAGGDDDDSELSRVCKEHQSRLMAIWTDIHEGHKQLVRIESDTIVQVEGLLTEQQLAQLDQNSQTHGADRGSKSIQDKKQPGSSDRQNQPNNNRE